MVVLHLHFPVMNPLFILQKQNQKKEVTNKDDSAVNKEKVIMLEEKFKLNINGVTEQRADFGIVDTAVI